LTPTTIQGFMRPMQPEGKLQTRTAKKPVSRLVFFAFFALFGSSCVAKHLYTVSAPPIERTVALVESDPAIAAALGAPVSVSLAVGTSIKRDLLRKVGGTDNVYVDTTVSGPKGQGSFEIRALNIGNQGWAGTFSVKAAGRPVLKNGGYVQEDAKVLVAGDFAPDGSPRPAKP
jgi:hypothetical protein